MKPYLLNHSWIQLPLGWVALAFLNGALASAQNSSPTETIQIQSRLVSITAVVRDDHGRFLPNLTKDDFILREDNKLQSIRYFNRDDDLPLQFGLLMDTSGSEEPYLSSGREASIRFLRRMLSRPDDKAFLVQFDTDVLLRHPMSTDLASLEHTLGQLSDRHPSHQNGGGTLLFDAIVGTVQNITSQIDGRRAIILFSDGQDEGSRNSLSEAAGWAQHADTPIYTILYGMDRFGALHSGKAPINSGRGVMEFLATSTGGRFFKVADATGGLPIENIFLQIEEDLRNEYRVGYIPPPSNPEKYHRIELQSKVKHTQVQARTGYYTDPAPRH